MLGQNNTKKIKIVIVDDSLFMRKLIRNMVETDKEIEVVGEAANGAEAIKLVALFRPDVVTMDFNMPVMDGERATFKILYDNPLPPAIIMVSASTKEGAEVTLRCLRAGAVDFIAKPSGETSFDIFLVKDELIRKIKAARGANIRKMPDLDRDISEEAKPSGREKAEKIVVIGASTGGPPVVENILSRLPDKFSLTVFVVQHMPEDFTRNFADRISKYSPYLVKESADQETISAGTCYIAKGGWHLKIEAGDFSSGGRPFIRLTREPKINGFRPAIDLAMMSAALLYKEAVLGIILTGMGSDGVEGMKAIKRFGGRTLAQSPESSVIPSMPLSIINAGLADEVLDIDGIIERIREFA